MIGEEPNPVSSSEYLQDKASEHINLFTTRYAEYRKLQDIDAKAMDVTKEYDEGIIAQIKSSLTSSLE
jgi:hypothetical protein